MQCEAYKLVAAQYVDLNVIRNSNITRNTHEAHICICSKLRAEFLWSPMEFVFFSSLLFLSHLLMDTHI